MIIHHTLKRRLPLLILLALLQPNLYAFLAGQGLQGAATGRSSQSASAGARISTQVTPGNLRAAPVTNCEAGEIVVKFKKGSQSATVLGAKKREGTSLNMADLSASTEIGPLLSKHGVKEVKSAFNRANRDTKKGVNAELKSKRENLFRWCRLSLPKDADLKKVLADFQAHGAVEVAEPVYNYRLHDVIDPPITGIPDATTDPDIGLQWHLNATHTQQAWNYLKENGVYPGGSRDVVVAVIDTGVDFTHPELIGNIWTNPREIAGNGLDDDGNGFVDDIHGCSVVSDARSHSGDCTDQHGHGTHVAGIIAAQAWNHQGGVGVAFNVQIMAIRAAQYSGVLTTTDISEGILYAVDNGAEVINMSFGGYQRSQMVIDALEMALNQSVLVAAAGNDGLNGWEYPCYPAALPYVHGVMATTADGMLAWFSNYGYDLAAPGESIYSTLPGDQYAAWSGTSMAAPVVSGIAALMRSYYWQRDIYSSRFLMGGLWAGGQDGVINAYKALTELPQPGVVMMENWLFDDKSISPRNDADGRIDSGETIHLAIEVINRSGQANNVVATLRAHAEGAVLDDPYVTLLTNTVDYGNIGPFNTTDNGFIYDSGGVIRGVERPFVFQVASNCPNDHVIPFELTISFEDGWNPENPGPYERISRFNYIVQRGKNIPRVISTNTVLSADEYWMVASPVLIEPGATLTIGPGTQVQWGGISDDPYNPGPQNGNIIVRGNLRVEGSSNQPVAFFPSSLVAGQLVSISVESGGTADMAFVKVRNPNLTGLRAIDHGDFEWDYGISSISALAITNSAFHKLRGGGSLGAQVFEQCLFDAGWLSPVGGVIRNCTYLQDNENDRPLSLSPNVTTDTANFTGIPGDTRPSGINHVTNYGGITYATTVSKNAWSGGLGLTPFPLPSEAELVARFFGGHLLVINSSNEQAFVNSYIEDYRAKYNPYQFSPYGWIMGLMDDGHAGQYTWIDGSPITFTNWGEAYPKDLFPFSRHVVCVAGFFNIGELAPWVGQWKNMPSDNLIYGAYYIMELPGDWTEAQLNAPMLDGRLLAWVRLQTRGTIIHNAFLNKYGDPNVSHWMRIVAQANAANTYSAMYDNYWGTATPELIDHAIFDYYDNFTSSHIDYAPPPAHGYASTYPFVEKVLIDGVSAETVPQLSGGRVEFTVSFNRDMDTNIEPFVTFGPSPPHTDFSVLPRDENFHTLTNGWLNPRTWQGSAWITPVTGEGYQLMRISGAVAADDPWLVSGYDVGRFRFEVRTMAIASMALQASGEEGAIRLTWQQNDYELLAGYNLFRADSTNGPWTRLNITIIPAGSENYLDTNVPPAVPKFYKFTVVTTDMTESEFSNIASAAALDTLPPVLTHTPVTSALPARGLRITAAATDNLRVASVTLYYRASPNGSNYTSLDMINVSSNSWSATIPGSAVQPPGLEYYLAAGDGISEVFSGTPTLPHLVMVSDVPTLGSVTPNHGPAAGGTPVTLAGTLFAPGAGVLFGNALASNVVVLSQNQLTCTAPPHFPAMVDVTVLNTNGNQSTLLNAFLFEETGIVVSLPNTNGNYGSQVELALSAANVAGLRAVDVTITFNASVLSAQSARLGTLTAGWTLSPNLNTPGTARFSLASATAVTGSGTLVLVRFNVIGAPPAATALTIANVTLNDGAMSAARSDGLFTVNGFFALSGNVRYYNGGGPVPNTALSLVGAGAFSTNSGTDGQFSITNVPTGSYTLTPSKTNDEAEITAYDASLALQAAAGLITLTPNQVLAADVNRNGLVSAMDASYVLEKAVGLIPGPFPGAGRLWDYIPAARAYSLLNSDQTGQDFTAVLIGDVSGNWTAPAGQGGSPPPPPPTFTKGVISNTAGSARDSVFITMDNGPLANGTDQIRRVLLKATNPIVYGIDLTLSYTPTNRFLGTVERGGITETLALAANTNIPGIMRVSLASAVPISGSGALVVLRFAGSAPVDCQIERIRINEDQVTAALQQTVAAFDSDGDGLIDADEVNLFYTDPSLADTDGDEMPDGAEVRAGTNPLASSSLLSIRSVVPSTNRTWSITWSSVPGKRYRLEYKDGIDAQPWSQVGEQIEALGNTTTVFDLNTATAWTRLYRVRLVE